MPHSRAALAALLFWLLSVAACAPRSEVSASIARNIKATEGKAVNLVAAVPGSWERVCILAPYSDNAAAKRTLGFEWDVERKTTIQNNEGISLLLFVKSQSVVQFTEHPRSAGDFSNLTGRCFTQEAAVFVYLPAPKKGWPGLFPEHEA
jgi:hypothetical protein